MDPYSHILCTAQAQVLFYDSKEKKWAPLGPDWGPSQLHITLCPISNHPIISAVFIKSKELIFKHEINAQSNYHQRADDFHVWWESSKDCAIGMKLLNTVPGLAETILVQIQKHIRTAASTVTTSVSLSSNSLANYTDPLDSNPTSSTTATVAMSSDLLGQNSACPNEIAGHLTKVATSESTYTTCKTLSSCHPTPLPPPRFCPLKESEDHSSNVYHAVDKTKITVNSSAGALLMLGQATEGVSKEEPRFQSASDDVVQQRHRRQPSASSSGYFSTVTNSSLTDLNSTGGASLLGYGTSLCSVTSSEELTTVGSSITLLRHTLTSAAQLTHFHRSNEPNDVAALPHQNLHGQTIDSTATPRSPSPSTEFLQQCGLTAQLQSGGLRKVLDEACLHLSTSVTSSATTSNSSIQLQQKQCSRTEFLSEIQSKFAARKARTGRDTALAVDTTICAEVSLSDVDGAIKRMPQRGEKCLGRSVTQHNLEAFKCCLLNEIKGYIDDASRDIIGALKQFSERY